MTCWNGHIPRMNTDQMRQAVEAYYEAYQREFAQRLDASIFLHDQPWHREPPRPERTSQMVHGLEWNTPGAREVPPPPRPERKRQAGLHEARPGDKVGAIDVEFRRVR